MAIETGGGLGLLKATYINFVHPEESAEFLFCASLGSGWFVPRWIKLQRQRGEELPLSCE